VISVQEGVWTPYNRSEPIDHCNQDGLHTQRTLVIQWIQADQVRPAQVTRSEDATRPKRVYLVAPSVRELLLADRKGQLKVMSTGVKTFERQDSKVTTHTHQ